MGRRPWPAGTSASPNVTCRGILTSFSETQQLVALALQGGLALEVLPSPVRCRDHVQADLTAGRDRVSQVPASSPLMTRRISGRSISMVRRTMPESTSR